MQSCDVCDSKCDIAFASAHAAPSTEEAPLIRTDAEVEADKNRALDEGLAMCAELWARLARSALDEGDARTAQEAAAAAIGLIPESSGAREVRVTASISTCASSLSGVHCEGPISCSLYRKSGSLCELFTPSPRSIVCPSQAVGPLLWRWVALAECIWSRAVASLINAETQDKPTQDDISTTAVRHAAAASRWAAQAKDPALALTIAK